MIGWVIGLSLAGMAFELFGILVVSGRIGAVRRLLREQARTNRAADEVGRAGETASEDESELSVPDHEGVARKKAYGEIFDQLVDATRADVRVLGERISDLEKRASRIEAELPDEVRRRAVAPVWGVVYLVAGLLCFVAANIVGVAA